MKWNKRHQIVLGFSIGLLLVVFSFWSRIVHAERDTVTLVKDYLNPEQVVVEEQQIQSKPVEPHTVEEQKIPIFVYHSVRPHVDKETKLQDLYDITPELFEKHLMYLRDNGYHVIVPRDLFVDEKTGKVVTNITNPVMLTFDDGWKNQYEYAYPLLKKYNTKAVFYIYTGPLGAPAFLDWKEIEEMKAGGMIIGSHTLHHPHMKKLSDDTLHREVFDSKKILEKKLGVPIEDFATPYGYSDDRIVAVVKEAGYRTSRTLYKSSYHKDLFTLKGFLTRDDINDFIYVLKQGN